MSDPARAALPITVIGGYLGAGKTTLLNSLLRQAGGRRLGVVVNDFGELGIDAERVAGAGAGDVVNLPNGCVCCTLGDDLRESLTRLAAATPPLDEIIVEASGVADPVNTAAWGTVPPFVGGGVLVLVAVDTVAARLRDRYVGGEVRRQIEGADLVVLTKLDCVDDDTVHRAREIVGGITSAPVVDVVSGDIDADLVLGSVRGVAALHEHVRGTEDRPSHDDRYVRWSVTSTVTVALDDLRAALQTLPDGLLRLKGSVSITPDSEPATTTGISDTGTPVVASDARSGDGGVGGRGAIVNVVGDSVDVAVRDGVRPGVRLEAIGVAGVLDAARLDDVVRAFGMDPGG